MAAAPLIVTPELLQQAWQQRPRHWPDSVEACQAHPVYSRLLRASAMGLAEADRRRAARAADWAAMQPPAGASTPAAPAPARSSPKPPSRPAQAALFDPKRLAAGDTDDDDD